jgi:murein DD-endopeptidase MepM/ murein hydrolase activator NlpD
VADGVVTEVSQENDCSGIHVSNLYQWNSVTLQCDQGGYVDYVHLQKGGVRVKVGQRVRQGEVLGKTGDVGFCPTPHLHLQLSLSSHAKAPTVPLSFSPPASPSSLFTCAAGNYYDANGKRNRGEN